MYGGRRRMRTVKIAGIGKRGVTLPSKIRCRYSERKSRRKITIWENKIKSRERRE